MRACHNEVIEYYEAWGPDLGPLLEQANLLVTVHDGIARVVTEPGINPDTGLFGYMVGVYLHG